MSEEEIRRRVAQRLKELAPEIRRAVEKTLGFGIDPRSGWAEPLKDIYEQRSYEGERCEVSESEYGQALTHALSQAEDAYAAILAEAVADGRVEIRGLTREQITFLRHPGMRPPTETTKEAEQRREKFLRASSECACPVCGHLYIYHPEDVPGFLHVLCNGLRVKL
jgi:hypothetical protein